MIAPPSPDQSSRSAPLHRYSLHDVTTHFHQLYENRTCTETCQCGWSTTWLKIRTLFSIFYINIASYNDQFLTENVDMKQPWVAAVPYNRVPDSVAVRQTQSLRLAIKQWAQLVLSPVPTSVNVSSQSRQSKEKLLTWVGLRVSNRDQWEVVDLDSLGELSRIEGFAYRFRCSPLACTLRWFEAIWRKSFRSIKPQEFQLSSNTQKLVL